MGRGPDSWGHRRARLLVASSHRHFWGVQGQGGGPTAREDGAMVEVRRDVRGQRTGGPDVFTERGAGGTWGSASAVSRDHWVRSARRPTLEVRKRRLSGWVAARG